MQRLIMSTRRRSRPVRRPRAGTADVLGELKPIERVGKKWRSHYEHLMELREHLMREQAYLNKDALDEQPRFSTHMADAATDHYDRDFALGLLSSEQDALYEIDEAIRRMRDDTYGICELTGKKIEPERLDAIPWTRFTAAAERKLEQDGELRGVHLGPRESVTPSRKESKAEEAS